MDRFLKLLNQYMKEQWIKFKYDEHEIDHWPTIRWLMSKDCWFIRRLIIKWKINLNKLRRKSEISKHLILLWLSYEEMLLMILSIKINPINFLIDIL